MVFQPSQTHPGLDESPHRNPPHGFVSAQPHKTAQLSTAWGQVVCSSILFVLGKKASVVLFTSAREEKKHFQLAAPG